MGGTTSSEGGQNNKIQATERSPLRKKSKWRDKSLPPVGTAPLRKQNMSVGSSTLRNILN